MKQGNKVLVIGPYTSPYYNKIGVIKNQNDEGSSYTSYTIVIDGDNLLFFPNELRLVGEL